MSTFELNGDSSWGGRPAARRVRDARSRCRLVVTGVISRSETAVLGADPVFRCRLDDGTGEIDLLFVGRRSVPGLTVGTLCSAEGTVHAKGRQMEIWNPLYRIEPSRSSVSAGGAEEQER